MHINNSLKKCISIILLFTLLFSSSQNVVWAEPIAGAEEALKDWVDSALQNSEITEFYWSEDDQDYTAYFLNLPERELTTQGESGIRYDPDGGGFTLKYYDGTTNKTYECIIDVKLDGKSVLARQMFHDLDKYGNMIELYLETDENGNVKSYDNSDLSISVIMIDESGNPILFQSATKTFSEKNDYNKVDASDNTNFFVQALKTIISILFKPIEIALRLLEIILNAIILAIADGAFAILSSALGETATVDNIIFGEYANINFWKSPGGIIGITSGVVQDWFYVFQGIGLTLYMAMLLWVGIKILWNSSSDSKARYKIFFKDWIVGMVLLLLFPYAIKSVIEINEGLVASVRAAGGAATPNITLNTVDDEAIAYSFGTDGFIALIAPNITGEQLKQCPMLYIRYLAARQARIPLAFVYCIMIFQTYVIAFAYCKRAFMLSFLVTIFPLVAMAYILDKVRRRNYKNRSIW